MALQSLFIRGWKQLSAYQSIIGTAAKLAFFMTQAFLFHDASKPFYEECSTFD